MKKLFLATIICAVTSFNAQDIEYVKQQAKILSAPDMYGRGYVKKGMEKSAKHIANSFKSMGLKSMSQGYFQNLTYDVNSFPKKIVIKVNGQEITAGEDYLVSAESGTSKGAFEVLVITKRDVEDLPHPKNLKDKIICLDNKGIHDKDSLGLFYQLREEYGQLMPVVWVNNNRLIWSVARRKMNHAILEVNPGIVSNGDQMTLKVRNKWIEDFEAKNVLGYVEGTEQPDSFIVFTGHYDHLGMMGKEACFYGANDNASGVAFMMSAAKHYVEQPAKYSVLFIAFTGEEAGLIGSKYYTLNPLFNLKKIKFLINMDLLGYGDEGITVVNATLHEKEFNMLNEINDKENLLVKIKKRGPAANSDHYWFEEAGVPSFFIYTMGGNQAYHDIYDRYENLTFSGYEDLFRLLTTFIQKL